MERQSPVGMDETYRSLFAPLVRVALLMTGSNAAAGGAVHAVFVRCAGRLDTLDDPPSYLRAAVVLRYFVDVHDDEMARILECRPATVQSLIRRALNDLRVALQ